MTLLWHLLTAIRSSHRRCSIKNGVLKNFAKLTGKHLCQSLVFNKVADSACNFIKKETLVQVFSCEFCKIFKNTFYTEHLWTTASALLKLLTDYLAKRKQQTKMEQHIVLVKLLNMVFFKDPS